MLLARITAKGPVSERHHQYQSYCGKYLSSWSTNLSIHVEKAGFPIYEALPGEGTSRLCEYVARMKSFCIGCLGSHADINVQKHV